MVDSVAYSVGLRTGGEEENIGLGCACCFCSFLRCFVLEPAQALPSTVIHLIKRESHNPIKSETNETSVFDC